MGRLAVRGTGIVTQGAVVHTLGVEGGAFVEGDGLRILGGIGRYAVAANAIIGERSLREMSVLQIDRT